MEDSTITYTPLQLSECDGVDWVFSNASIGDISSSGNEAVQIEIGQGNSVEACMTITRFQVGGESCSETFCNTITATAEVQVGILKIYPNPVRDVLFVEMPKNMAGQSFTLEISDIIGKQLQVLDEQLASGALSLNVQDITPGIYFLILTNENGERLVNKFVRN